MYRFSAYQESSGNFRNNNDPCAAQGFSDFSAAQFDAGKHVSLITELSRQVDARNLMQVSSVRLRHLRPFKPYLQCILLRYNWCPTAKARWCACTVDDVSSSGSA